MIVLSSTTLPAELSLISTPSWLSDILFPFMVVLLEFLISTPVPVLEVIWLSSIATFSEFSTVTPVES